MYTQIHAWLNGTHPLPRRFSVPGASDTSDAHWLLWVGLDEVYPLHEAASLDWHTLEESAERARRYVADAVKILKSNRVSGSGDKAAVIGALGSPPPQATPLYIISVLDGSAEKAVYVGKTTSNSRFSNGHHAVLGLLAPEFNLAEKLIYRCSLTVSLGRDHVALEWIDPLAVAGAILDGAESRLIYSLQPVLNRNKRKVDLATNKCAVHVQNTIEECRAGSFLNDYIVDQLLT